MKVLILGDGNFSFTLALCRLLFNNSRPKKHNSAVIFKPTALEIEEESKARTQRKVATDYLGIDSNDDSSIQVVATSFDSRQQLLSKYQETKEILPGIEKFGPDSVRLIHQINAWELGAHFGTSSDKLAEGEGANETSMPIGKQVFDIVVWNHPHLGTEDFRLHRFLMAHFFESVKHVLAENGRVCMSLVYGQHERWDIVHQANRFSLNPDAIIDFEPNLWPGYEVKRNKHGKSFKNEPTKRQHRCDMRSIAFRFSTSSTSTTSTVIPHSFLEQQIKYMSLEDTESASKTVTTTTSLAKPFICPQCSRGFSTLRGRDNHVHTMHILKIRGEEWKSEGPKMYACDHCPKTFKMQEDLWQHAINKHTEIDSSELPELKQVLGEEGNTSITPPTAVTNEGGVKDTEYDYTPCSICGQAVVRRDWGMLLHLETLKPAVGLDMSCPLCKNQSFIESRALFQHYKFCRLKQKKVE